VLAELLYALTPARFRVEGAGLLITTKKQQPCRFRNLRQSKWPAEKIIRGVKFTDGCEVSAKPRYLHSQTAAA
jgi:hypothetical protein